MKETPAVSLGRSLAGHDKNRVYYVVREDESFYYICDGQSRNILSPKKKRRMHIQPIIHLSGEIMDMIRQIERAQEEQKDLLIHQMLSFYNERTSRKESC